MGTLRSAPAEGWPKEKWQLRSPAELLSLKVCDMAMGSAAFLVQACRYLSERLLEAWEIVEHEMARKGAKDAKGAAPSPSQGEGRDEGRNAAVSSSPRPLPGRERETVLITVEGEPTSDPNKAIPANPDDRLALARRLITDRCLYGVDKNPLAVEMAKLSLWLITLDKGRPFTFLDHALKCGDSLVGVSLDQLSHWSLDTTGTPALFAEGIRLDIQKMIALRRQIAATPTLDARDQAAKAYLHAQAEAIAHDLRQGANLLIASYYNDLPTRQQTALRNDLLHVYREGKDAPVNTPSLGDLRPFHWQIEFPEVFLADGRGGFDAFVGNPPFVGGRRVRDTLGDIYRDALYSLYADSSGNADYCAFFFLRGFQHLGSGGTLGLIATNTIAQGDTRQTGLDYILAQGGTIYGAINSQPWSGQSAVVVSIVQMAKRPVAPPFDLDHHTVQHISSYLDSRPMLGKPHVLAQNDDKSHMGTNLVGEGFILSHGMAGALITASRRNLDVLFPFLNGHDLNSSPTQSPSRWAVTFFDWPLEKAETYPDCIRILRDKVLPERMGKPGGYARFWWQHGRRQERLYEAIDPLQRILIVAQTSSTLAFVFVPKGMVYSHATIVFAFEDCSHFAVMQSNCHISWVLKYASTLKGDARYIPTDCFETYPFPAAITPLESIGEAYHERRRQVMLSRQEGLTKTYNRFHKPEETAADIARLRELHVQMDQAVAAAYGWHDLNLSHGFHQTAQGLRFTISEPARREVLSRLLALNHERYEEEAKAGLHAKKGGKGKRGTKAEAEGQMRLV